MTARRISTALIVALAAVGTGSAEAATVTVGPRSIDYLAATGERNALTVSVMPAGVGFDVLFGDSGAPVTPGPGCRALSARQAACSIDDAADQLVSIQAGDLADSMVLPDTALDTVVDGGAGNDTITGGRGFDRLMGGPGDDIFRVRDGFADEVVGGFGVDLAELDLRDVVASDVERGDRKPVRERPSIQVLGSAARLSRDAARVRLRCPRRAEPGGCKGALRLDTVVVTEGGAQRPRTHLGTETFALARGRSETIVIEVPERRRRSLGRRTVIRALAVSPGRHGEITTFRTLRVRGAGR